MNNRLGEPGAEIVQRHERRCVWVIYGAPVLLTLITLSMYVMLEFRIIPFPMGANIAVIVTAVNAILAGLISASGEVLRRGSLFRRVASGLLYCVAGIALYLLCLTLTGFFYHLVRGL